MPKKESIPKSMGQGLQTEARVGKKKSEEAKAKAREAKEKAKSNKA